MSLGSDILGQMTLTEDGAVVQSSGELSNNEKLAKKFTNMVQTAVRLLASDPDMKNSNFRRISVVWQDCAYVLTISNHKIFVVKRVFVAEEQGTVS